MSTIGRIIGGAPTIRYDGSELAADASTGDTTLTVVDAGDFDDDALINGGAVMLGVEVDNDGNLDLTGAVVLPYTTFDDDTSVVTLADPLAADWSTGDAVYILDPVTGEPVVAAEVWVEVEGADHTGTALPAIVTYGILGKIGATDDDANGQVVTLEEDEDEQLVVVDVHGSGSNAPALEDEFYEDEVTASGPGDVTLELTYIPVPHSEHLYWGGLYQPGSEWTRDRWTVSIPDPDEQIRAGQRFVMEYAYRDPGARPVPAYSVPTWFGRSGAWGSHPTSFITSCALHADTQVGDLLVAVAVGEGDGGVPAITDPRMTTVGAATNLRVAVGYADDLSDMVCHVGGTNFPIDQFAGIEVLAVRGDDGFGVAYDPARLAVTINSGHGAITPVGGSGHGVIMATAAGVINGITIDMGTYCPDFTDWGGTISAPAVLGNFGYTADDSAPTQHNPTNTNALTVLIGLR